MITIFLISWRRNEWKTISLGNFIQEIDVFDEGQLTEQDERFSVLVPKDVLDPLMKKESTDGKSSSIL